MSEANARGQRMRQQRRIERLEVVPVDPFRERFLELERQDLISAYEVAKRMWEAGYSSFSRRPSPSQRGRGHGDIMADGTRLKRVIGVKMTPRRTRSAPSYARYINYEYAVTLAEILGMDPVDAGV